MKPDRRKKGFLWLLQKDNIHFKRDDDSESQEKRISFIILLIQFLSVYENTLVSFRSVFIFYDP